MLHRLVSCILFLGGSLALGLGAYSYFAENAGPSLVAQESDIKVADCRAGETRRVAIRLHNDSRRLVRIIGVEEC